MPSVIDKPGAAFAQEVLSESAAGAATTPFELLLQAENLTDDQCFRLLGHLWMLKRLMYYVYGGWAMGLNLNEYPSTVAYLLAKQTYDESTHEMQYVDEILRRKWVRTQTEAFQHPYCKYSSASRVSYYIFTLRGMANFPHNIRIASLNLGAKVIELAWLERFADSFPDEALRAIFAGQVPETRSHVQMGRLIVEKYMSKPVDFGLTKAEIEVVKRDYIGAMDGIAGFVFGVDDVFLSEEVVLDDVD